MTTHAVYMLRISLVPTVFVGWYESTGNTDAEKLRVLNSGSSQATYSSVISLRSVSAHESARLCHF